MYCASNSKFFPNLLMAKEVRLDRWISLKPKSGNLCMFFLTIQTTIDLIMVTDIRSLYIEICWVNVLYISYVGHLQIVWYPTSPWLGWHQVSFLKAKGVHMEGPWERPAGEHAAHPIINMQFQSLLCVLEVAIEKMRTTWTGFQCSIDGSITEGLM